MNIKNFSLFLLCSFVVVNSFSQILTTEEETLYKLITEYRAHNGLNRIPISKSLTFVAQTHVHDLVENQPVKGICNPHSWSSEGQWTGCCYTADHANAKCMWNKPRELTTYKGNGYEIAFWNPGSANALDALESWKTSPPHNSVLLNQDIWAKLDWNAIGIGIYNGYAVVWFGHEVD